MRIPHIRIELLVLLSIMQIIHSTYKKTVVFRGTFVVLLKNNGFSNYILQANRYNNTGNNKIIVRKAIR